jgi:hypothetical protein
MTALAKALESKNAPEYSMKPHLLQKAAAVDLSNSEITYDAFGKVLNEKWISKSTDTTCVVDASFCLNTAVKNL